MDGEDKLEYRLYSNSPVMTMEIARRMGGLLKPGDVLCLYGELGAGKTCFVQGLARGMGITSRVNSPTFTIVKEYPGVPPLYHFDVYRLANIEELIDIGFDEYIAGDGVCVIEWADKIETALPADRLDIKLNASSPGEREIVLLAHGSRATQLLEGVRMVVPAGA